MKHRDIIATLPSNYNKYGFPRYQAPTPGPGDYFGPIEDWNRNLSATTRKRFGCYHWSSIPRDACPVKQTWHAPVTQIRNEKTSMWQPRKYRGGPGAYGEMRNGEKLDLPHYRGRNIKIKKPS